MNSIESKPRPSDDTNIAELILARWERSAITVDGSSADHCGWMCWKTKYGILKINIKFFYNSYVRKK